MTGHTQRQRHKEKLKCSNTAESSLEKKGDLKLDRTIQLNFMESARRTVEGSEQEGRKKRREGTGKRKETGKGVEGGQMAGERVLWER